MTYPWVRLRRFTERKSASLFFREPLAINSPLPVISFTFDDFPRTALYGGGTILRRFGGAGTYYTCLGLLGKSSPSGQLCVVDDLHVALREGHELGCHTYSHCHSWQTKPVAFEASVLQNSAALADLIPGAKFESLSFPLSEPRPMTKRRASQYFACCRAGGQRFNSRTADLNQLSAFFLEFARGDLEIVKNLIDQNREAHGWLIFATHDIVSNPSRYGCTPEFFEQVVQYAAASGARILPIAKALQVIRGKGLSM
jgi:peptidoglycan/xylan/chitin deacetylase (PgdA/CDA1 family)